MSRTSSQASRSPAGPDLAAPGVRMGRRLRGVLLGSALAASTLAALPTPVRAGEVLDKALPILRTLYLHKDHLVAADMAREGIQALERAGVDVLVTETEAGVLTVRAGSETRTFRVDGLDRIEDLGSLLAQACAFVEGAMAPPDRPIPGGLQALALRGVLGTVDRHSQVIVGESLEDFSTRFEGTLVGIGARVGQRQGALRVLKPFPGTPAARAGLLPHDEIVAIDGYPASALSTDEAVDRIRGPAQVPVVLTVRRAAEDGVRAFVIAREKVVAPSVESERLEGGIALVTIDHFSQETSGELSRHLEDLRLDGPLHGVILDLRDNSGGSLIHSARVVNTFAPEGQIVRTEGRDGEQVEGLTPAVAARADRVAFDGPVAILVNGKTASGSEIVAGALKALGRSLTIGSQTFGKGTVQKVFKIDDAVSMKLTVARWLLPGDRYINLVGVTPDVATSQLWLDPVGSTVPDLFEERPSAEGRREGDDGLDPRRRAGSGRAPSVDGDQAAPALSLWYGRVLPGWGPTGGETKDAETPAEPSPLLARSMAPGDAGEPRWNDVELALAWDVLSRAAPADRREELLDIASDLVTQHQKAQDLRFAGAAAAGGLKWAKGPATWLDRRPSRTEAGGCAAAGLAVDLKSPDFVAGSDGAVQLTVHNTGRTTRTHLRAVVRSSSSALDGLGFLVGDLAAGEQKTLTAKVQVPRSTPSRVDGFRTYLLDDEGLCGDPETGSLTVRGLAPPTLEVSRTISSTTDSEGQARWDVSVRVRNAGSTATGEIRAWLDLPAGVAGVDRLERFRTLPEAAPGATVDGMLHAQSRPLTAGAAAPTLELNVRDQGTGHTLELPVPLAADPGTSPLVAAEVLVPGFDGTTPARGTASYELVGEVRAAAGLDSVEIFAGDDKIWAQSSGGKKGLAQAPFRVAVPLYEGPNRVVVRTRTLEGVERSWSGWIFGETPAP